MMIFLMILAVVAVAIFTSLKLAFLIFLGLVAIVIIAMATMIGGFIRLADESEEGHGPMDKMLFGEDK
jgi:membrane protein implicated in regulation of membrane protease activity